MRGYVDHVFVWLCQRRAFRGPWTQHLIGGFHHVRGGPGSTPALDGICGSFVHRGRGLVNRSGVVWIDQKRRPALAQCWFCDPTQRDHENRHALDVGVVVSKTRRPVAALRVLGGWTVVMCARGLDRETT